MTLALLIAVSLSATAPEVPGPVAVVVGSKRPQTEQFSQELAASLRVALARENLAGLLDEPATAQRLKNAGADPARCNGGKTCLANVARALGPSAVVASVDAAKLDDKVIVRLEAIEASAGESLAVQEFTTGTQSLYKDSAGPLAKFARTLADRLRAPPAAADVPRATALTPPPAVADPARELTAGPPKPAPILPVVLTSAAVASLAAAVVFGALGLNEKAAIDGARYELDGRSASRLSQSELDARAARGNAELTVCLVTGIAGLALGTAAGVAWGTR